MSVLPRTFGDLLKMRGTHPSDSHTCQFCKKWGKHIENGEVWKYSVRHYVCRPCILGRLQVVLPSVKRYEKINARFAEIRAAEAPAISGEAFSGRIVKAILPLFAIAIMLHMGGAIAAPAPEPLTPPSCSSDRQCAAMWAAARDWVASSCGMKIQTISDGFIETYGPRDGNAYCRVWRDPLPAGGYTFHAKVDYGAPFMGKYMRQMLEGLVAALNSTAAAFK